jgi:hypothetical protein
VRVVLAGPLVLVEPVVGHPRHLIRMLAEVLVILVILGLYHQQRMLQALELVVPLALLVEMVRVVE